MDREVLAEMENDYRQTPAAFQGAELRAINALREALGMAPTTHAELTGAKPTKATTAAAPKKAERDLSRAEGVYQQYLAKLGSMRPHREYAERVARATMDGKTGQTPVKPLATMGCGGGALVCDWCGKPLILEGGRFHGKPVDVAWANNPERENNWLSWIYGGMVVDVATNGTVRVYHGHRGNYRTDECSYKGARAIEVAEIAFKNERPDGILDELFAFVEKFLPEVQTERDRLRLVGEIANEVYGFDPGIGKNRPE